MGLLAYEPIHSSQSHAHTETNADVTFRRRMLSPAREPARGIPHRGGART